MKIMDMNEFSMNRLENKVKKVNPINEAFSGKIMALISRADKISNRAWYSSFVKDFYKTFNISIDKIKDEDWSVSRDPLDWFKGEYRNSLIKDPNWMTDKPRYLAVFLNEDKALEVEASKDAAELESYLKARKFSEEEIKSLVDIYNSTDSVEKFRTAIKKIMAGKEDITEENIENIVKILDAGKKLSVPFISCIMMGGHAVYNNFRMIDEARLKQEPWAKRYGIVNANWLIPRYYGVTADTKVTKYTIPQRVTTVYYVDLEAVHAKYDMGTKLEDRAEAKKNNPFFMTDDDWKKAFSDKFALYKAHSIDPESISNMFQALIQAYTKHYVDRVTIADPKKMADYLDDKIEINGTEVKGSTNILMAFDNMFKEYMKVYAEEMEFMKRLRKKYDEARIRDTSREELTSEEQSAKDALTGYSNTLINFKKRAQDLYSEMSKLGVKMPKTSNRLFM